MSETSGRIGMEMVEDDSFSFDGFQVVRGEFFAHTYEPSITFCDGKVYVNTACVRKLPEYNYIQILVNPDEKKLAVRPCAEAEKDSFRWCSATEKRTPKHISCRIFFAKVFTLMGWNTKDRYKLLGKLIKAKGEILFIYDLSSPEVYKRNAKEDGSVETSRTPNYPADWQTQFGLPVTEHSGRLVVSIFKDTAVFGLKKEPEGRGSKEAAIQKPPESEAEVYEQISLLCSKGSPDDHDRPEEEAPEALPADPGLDG